MNQHFNINLIEILYNEPRVSHIHIAEFTNNKPKSILDLITRNISELEEFGVLQFKISLVKSFFKMKKSLSIQPAQKPQTQLSEFKETLDFIDIFEKLSEKTKGKSNLELLQLDSFLTNSDKKSILEILNFDLKNSYFSVSELGEFSGQKGSEINQA